MKLDVVDQPSAELLAFFEHKIDEYNWANWDVKQRLPLAVTVCDAAGPVVAGGSARSFGHWLLLDHLWVAPELRGQDWGSRVLAALENKGRERGCRQVLLDTLEFQARPFYERHGYTVQWTQQGYPRQGSKYFMTKAL